MSVPGTAADVPISCSGAISTVPGTGPRRLSPLESDTPARRAHAAPGGRLETPDSQRSTFDFRLSAFYCRRAMASIWRRLSRATSFAGSMAHAIRVATIASDNRRSENRDEPSTV